jgi:hypothetical protein
MRRGRRLRVASGTQYTPSTAKEFLAIVSHSTFAVIEPNHTWVIYGHDGVRMRVVNSGTWSLGSADPRSGLPSSRSVGAAAARPHGERPALTKDIALDGADGFHLVTPSAGLGLAGTVDGQYRFPGFACPGVIGALTTITKDTKSYVVTFSPPGFDPLVVVMFSDHRWISFESLPGNQIFRIIDGTWSNGFVGC